MAFCRNCGSELSEGTKFCPSCGAAVEGVAEVKTEGAGESSTTTANPVSAQQDEKKESMTPPVNVSDNNGSVPASGFDKFGKFYGIILMVLSFAGFAIDNPAVKVILSVIIIVGCIFCFVKKYKLKFFTIVALILAIICLLSGLYRAGVNGRNASLESSKGEDTAATSTVESLIASGVNPELKEFLDSYEAFIDEYVDFMKNYNEDPGNAISLLADYTEMMLEYADFAEKISEYDSEDMSVADAAYYLEVVNRCNKKLLELY